MARAFVAALSQYLKSATSPISTTPLTLACWIKPNTFPGTAVTMAVSLAAGTVNAHGLYLTGTTGVLHAFSQAGAAVGDVAGSAISAGVWSHIAGVFTSSTSRTPYTNGSAGTTDTTSANPSGMDHVSIGAWLQSSTVGNYTDGVIAEAGVWNVALDGAEVAALAAAVSPLLVRSDALVAYWPLMGITSPEIDPRGRFEMTVTGATAAAHPRIYLPSSPQSFTTKTAVAATGQGRMFQVF